MIIKAAVIYEKHGPFVIKDVELAEPQEDEVVVRIAGCGICHTDECIREDVFGIPFPIIPGHEGSGVVEKIGGSVKNLKPGDKVLFAPYSVKTLHALSKKNAPHNTSISQTPKNDKGEIR